MMKIETRKDETMAVNLKSTDYRVDDRVTVCDSKSMHYLLTGTVGRIHSINGEIFYDVCLPHRNGVGCDSWLLTASQLYNETKFN